MPIHTDHEQLIAWVRDNLDGYWRRWHRRSSQALSRQGLVGLTPWAPTWGVLGVSRLHHTIGTGLICSKTAGGLHARREFGTRWHAILDECLRIRSSASRRSRYPDPITRRSESLAFVEMVIGARSST